MICIHCIIIEKKIIPNKLLILNKILSTEDLIKGVQRLEMRTKDDYWAQG